VGTSDYARYVFETALSKKEAYNELQTGLAGHRNSGTALRIHKHFNRRFGHFARTVPRGLGRGEGYGDTVVTFLERAKMPPLMWRLKYWDFPQLAYPATLAPRCVFPYVLEAWGLETWLPLRMRRTSEGSVWRWAPLSVSLQRKTLVCAGIPTAMFQWNGPCTDG
jgi:hypothetical protein